MRLGKVYIDKYYVVDLDNEDMVQHAKDALWEDMMESVKHDFDLDSIMDVKEDSSLTEDDIEEFLKAFDNWKVGNGDTDV